MNLAPSRFSSEENGIFCGAISLAAGRGPHAAMGAAKANAAASAWARRVLTVGEMIGRLLRLTFERAA